MATDFEKNPFKTNLSMGSAAMRKMQEIASFLYDSTPGLQEGNLLVLLLFIYFHMEWISFLK